MAPGPRRANGRHLPDATPADAVAKWKRLRDQAEAQALDPRWGSAVGKLMWFKQLTDREAAAADRWAEWCGRHDRIKGFPPRSVASPQYQVGYGRSVDHLVGVKKSDQEFMERFDAARRVIGQAGSIMALIDVAVLDQPPATQNQLERMQAALRALLLHWGM